jgi:hypothetical protein
MKLADVAFRHFPAIRFGRAPRSERPLRVGPFRIQSGPRPKVGAVGEKPGIRMQPFRRLGRPRSDNRVVGR